MIFSATLSFADLTAEQRAEQQRQQRAAQRAFQASADTHNEVARTAEIYKEGAEITRDTAAEGVYYGTGGRVDARNKD